MPDQRVESIASSAPARTAVLLLHGLWMGPLALRPLARRFRSVGIETDRFGYASVRGGPEPAIAALAERLALAPASALVAHSLGGLITLETLRRYPDLPVRRVVCLGSPLCGSRAATGLSRWRFGQGLIGRSAELLRTGLSPWQGAAEVGVIAGTRGLGAGRLLARLAVPHDGTVEVAETRLPGIRAHLELPVTHTGLLFSESVATAALRFLADGVLAVPRPERFAPEPGPREPDDGLDAGGSDGGD